MSDALGERLLARLALTQPELASQAADRLAGGDTAGAINLLSPHFDPATPDKAVGTLLLHWHHQSQAYVQANAVLDAMIGMNLSTQLSLANCPQEDDIVASWRSGEDTGVSIVCTTFNHARFIGMALASFISQASTRPFEVIVRDDASTDGTTEIVRHWQARYPRLIRLELMPQNTYRQGIAPMPAALALARYPLVALCEGDDFWVDPDKLERQARLLCDNPRWSAVFHNHFELDEVAGQLKVGRSLRGRGFFDRNDLLCVNVVLWVHTLMLRKSRLDLPHYSLRDGILGDQVLTCTLGLGGPVYYLGDLVASVARRNLASTYTPLDARAKQRLRIQTKAFLADHLRQAGEALAAQRLRDWSDRARTALQAPSPVT